MDKVNLNILRVLLFIWCLPQNIAGFIYTRRTYKLTFNIVPRPDNVKMTLFRKLVQFIRINIMEPSFYLRTTEKENRFGVSLGNFIFCKMRPGVFPSSEMLNHENGHRVQSVLLGWFYLPVIGITSLSHYIYWWFKQRSDKNSHGIYHEFWTEKWADKLGNM